MKPVCHSTLLFLLLVITGSIAQDDPNKDLVEALKKDDASAAQAAISGGADINGKDAEGVTPLIFAAGKCSPLMIKMLLHNRAEVNLRGVRDLTPLIFAAMEGRTSAVPLLIRAGADLNAKTVHGGTALMYAAYSGYQEIVEALVKAGADLSLKESRGYTALALAEQARKTNVVKFLQNAQNPATAAPQTLSASKPAEKMSALGSILLGHKERPQPAEKFTVDQLKQGFHAKDLQALRECRAKEGEERWTCADEKLKRMDVNLSNEDGVTFLMAAALSGDVRFAKLLLAHKADPNLKDNNGETALMKATRGGYTEVVELLKEKPNASKRTEAELIADAHFYVRMLALGKCKAKQDLDQIICLEAILSTVDNINYQEKNGKTLLMLAAEKDDIILTRLVLDRKPDMHLKDKNGETALMLANKNATFVLINLLKRFGAKE